MEALAEQRGPCLVNLAAIWSLYGGAMLVFWRAVHERPWGDLTAWLVGLAAAGCVLLATGEI